MVSKSVSWWRTVSLRCGDVLPLPTPVECARLPNVDLQIMPRVSPHHAGLGGPFRLLETEDNEWLGYSEGQRSGRVLSDAKDISLLHQRYAKLRIQALNPADSTGLLMRMRGSL
ncbi:Scr1 family TA system antitoxin-like transcriptional regulator [Streptomyces sp. NPDC000656]